MSISSKIIIGARPPAALEAQLLAEGGYPHDAEAVMCVFEVLVDAQVRYCCWAGGKLIGPPPGVAGPPLPSLTVAGQAACLALAALPFVDDCKLVFHGLLPGKTPLRERVLWAFRQTQNMRAVLCFVGDLAGALNGQMATAFGLHGAVAVANCVGMRPLQAGHA